MGVLFFPPVTLPSSFKTFLSTFFYIRTNFIRTRLKLVENKSILRTLWDWEVQAQKIEITMIYVSFNNLRATEWLNTIKVINYDVIRCSIGGYNFIFLKSSSCFFINNVVSCICREVIHWGWTLDKKVQKTNLSVSSDFIINCNGSENDSEKIDHIET